MALSAISTVLIVLSSVLCVVILGFILRFLLWLCLKKKKAANSSYYGEKSPSILLPAFEKSLFYSLEAPQNQPLETDSSPASSGAARFTSRSSSQGSLNLYSFGEFTDEELTPFNTRRKGISKVTWRSEPDISSAPSSPNWDTAAPVTPWTPLFNSRGVVNLEQPEALLGAKRRVASMPNIFSPMPQERARKTCHGSLTSGFDEVHLMTLQLAYPHGRQRSSSGTHLLHPLDASSLDETSVRKLTTSRGSKTKKKIKKLVGKLSFSIEYLAERQTLEVDIQKAFIFPLHEQEVDISPFVRVYLRPGKKQKQNTKTHRNTKEPLFDEKKYFHEVSAEGLSNYRLSLKVYNRVSLGKNQFIGACSVPLSALDTTQYESHNLNLYKDIDRKTTGKIMISLCHEAVSRRLRVIVHKAIDLRKVGVGKISPDPYVSLLFSFTDGWKKLETKIKRKTCNPVFNETFHFEVSADCRCPLSECSLVITVFHQSLVGHDKILGHSIFCSESPDFSTSAQWKYVSNTPLKMTTEWYPLLDPQEL